METPQQRICVFTGSSPGARPEYRASARELGHALVLRGFGLVFGGGHVGLMGAIADAVIEAGGHATGVIPRALEQKELAHQGVHELDVVASMHERKARMADLSSAFVALPGGLGTLEELFEVLTWAQLGFHGKPVGLLNVCGYFDPLLAFVDQAVEQRFVSPKHRDLLLVESTPPALLDRIAAYEPEKVEKWLDRSAT